MMSSTLRAEISMTPVSPLEDLFFSALALPPSERMTWLDQHCTDRELRAQLDRMMAAHARLPGFLEPATATFNRGDEDRTSSVASEVPSEAAGVLLAGRYRLREQIGEGGMGSIWLADQTEPVKRRVAVKLIKAGMDSKQVLARFEAERQALAMMDHPNIAKVLDGGLHESRPYFVMELVKGIPITEYCDAKKLTPKERLELFVPVCQAIQHAHQKGIIHRDLKPSNVLIALYDDKPVPKVIDFGVAKATGATLTERTIDTGFGGIVGTPQYMSPEQATFNNLDIDTRSDVYSLGVLLYELLAGSPPFAQGELEKRGLLEILRVVREEEPPRPSTKLSTANALPSLSANRGTEPKKLTGLLRNELDWIVMKALEKDRSRRYETANGFAADINRYLAGEAVLAHPPSRAYRLKKFAQKNRTGVLVASAFVALMAGAVAVGAYLTVRATNAEDLARRERDGAVEARTAEAERAEGERLAKLAAQNANDLTAKRLKQIELINNTVFDIFAEFDIRKVKEGNDPVEYVLAKKLAEAGRQLDENAIDDPLVLASLRHRLAFTLANLGDNQSALKLFDQARQTRAAKLGSDHPDTIYSLFLVADEYRELHQFNRALPLFADCLSISKAKLRDDHPDTITYMGGLARCYLSAGKYKQAIPLYEQTTQLMKAREGPHHLKLLTLMSGLALCYQGLGQIDRAMTIHKENLPIFESRLGPSHPDTLTCLDNLAGAYEANGDFDRASQLMQDVVKRSRSKLGADHPGTLNSMRRLASNYEHLVKMEMARSLFEEILTRAQSRLGFDHPNTLQSMVALGLFYADNGKLDLALPLLEKCLSLTKAKMGRDHPLTFSSMNALAYCYKQTGKVDRAILLEEEALAMSKAMLGLEHHDTSAYQNNLATFYLNAGQFQRALPLLEESWALHKVQYGPDHPGTITTMSNLGNALVSARMFNRAIPLLEEALALSKARQGVDHPRTFFVMNNLACGYSIAGMRDRSLPLFAETLKRKRAVLGNNHPETMRSIRNLANDYELTGKYDIALPLFEESLTLRTAILGIEHPETMESLHFTLSTCAKTGKVAHGLAIYKDYRKHIPLVDPQLSGGLALLALSLLQNKEFAEAEPMLGDCLAIRLKHEPDDWKTYNTQSQLGGVYLGQKKYDEAEPMLLKGYEGMKQREKTIPSVGATRIPEALDRLIALYTATNKPDEVKKWRAERAKYKELAPSPRAAK